jgi:hypothetical protein
MEHRTHTGTETKASLRISENMHCSFSCKQAESYLEKKQNRKFKKRNGERKSTSVSESGKVMQHRERKERRERGREGGGKEGGFS